MTEPPGRVAAQIDPGIPDRDDIAFVYGQGSSFAGFADAADIDLVVVWQGASIPERNRRIGAATRAQFEGHDYALDKLEHEVDVIHFTLQTFNGWCDAVELGGGWSEESWPQPLHVVAGFVNGEVLSDPRGQAAALLARLRMPSTEVVRQLGVQLDSYLVELRSCARREDHWLSGRLTDRLMRHCYIAWFATEGFLCPFPKHLDEWIRRLGLTPEVARLERAVWLSPTLSARADAVEVFARRILA